MHRLLGVLAAAALAFGGAGSAPAQAPKRAATAAAAAATPVFGVRVVRAYPHDRTAYTQGLLWQGGALYESTGQVGQSQIRRLNLATGAVVKSTRLPPQVFGEGMAYWKGKLVSLTWLHQTGFIHDFSSFSETGRFRYQGEGWGLASDGRRLIMSDGTAVLRFWNGDTLQETGRVTVTDRGRPVTQLNELEVVKGKVYANVWQTDRIAVIDPASGRVTAWIDCTGLLPPAERTATTDVLNGIAYDAAKDRLFLTGKNWPKLYEVKLVRR